jgi:hypothetical protein
MRWNEQEQRYEGTTANERDIVFVPLAVYNAYADVPVASRLDAEWWFALWLDGLDDIDVIPVGLRFIWR